MPNIKKPALLLLIAVFLASLLMPLQVAAGTIARGNTKTPARPTEVDNYNPAADPLPEWLVLPEGVDENQLQFKGDPATSQVITYTAGSDKWIINIKNNGRQVVYRYYVNRALQFLAVTSQSYNLMVVKNAKGEKIATLKGEELFSDETVDQLTAQAASQSPCAAGWTNRGSRCVPQLNKKLSKRQLQKLTFKTGFRGEGRRVAVAVAQAESGGRVGSVLCNAKPPFNPRQKFEAGVSQCRKHRASADRGLWQVNDYWHKKVSNQCAFSSVCNAKAAYKISNGGREWQWWSTFQNGSYRQYL